AMTGELRAGLSTLDPRGIWAMGLPGASIINAGRNSANSSPNNKLYGSGVGDELEDATTWCTPDVAARGLGCDTAGRLMIGGMGVSQHTGGVHMGLADGSVRFISENIDQVNWCRLVSRSDGQVLDGSGF